MRLAPTASTTVRGSLLGLALAFALPAAAAEKPARYLWNLASETGPLRTSASGVSIDPFAHEILVSCGDAVRIYQPNGMEDFSFQVAGMMDRVLAAAALGENGDIALLGVSGQDSVLARVSFRGELVGRIERRGEAFPADFHPNVLRVHASQLYLADTTRLLAVVLEQDGQVVKSVDLGEIAGVEDAKRSDNQLSGFGVDVDGGLLFTISVKFKAWAVSPSGDVRSWGTPGGAPGFFNVVSGIAADQSNYYVADQLKSAVIAFSRADLSFVDEFGYRREAAGGLIGPTNLAAGNGRVFVSQDANRGVAVFSAPEAEVKVSAAVDAAASRGEATPQ